MCDYILMVNKTEVGNCYQSICVQRLGTQTLVAVYGSPNYCYASDIARYCNCCATLQCTKAQART